MKLVSQQVELFDDPKEDNFWQVKFDNGIFIVESLTDSRIRKFKLLKTPSELTDDERYSVLNYRLANVRDEDEVCLEDIFLQAEFIEEILEEVDYEVDVRVSECGEYDNTITAYVTIPKQENEDDVISILAKEVRSEVENDYGTHEAWDEGEVSWTVEDYRKLEEFEKL